MKKLMLLITSIMMCFSIAGCGTQTAADYSSYEGKTYEGTSPWDGQVSVSIDKISDGTMDWSYLEEVTSAGWGYNIQMSSKLTDGKGDFEIQAESDNQQAEYTGTIELKDNTVILTYEDGQKTEIAEDGEGGNGYEMAGALEDDQKTIVLKESTNSAETQTGDAEVAEAVTEAEANANEATTEAAEETADNEDLAPEMDSSDFVLLSDAVPDAILEIRYYSTYNFVGRRIAGYEQPVALITKEAAEALKKASDEAISKGYRLKIYDAYRPQTAVTDFEQWAEDLEDTKMKEYFYPELDKSVLFDQGYIASKSGHSRGSTVDITLFDMKTEKEVDMGGTFDYFGIESHPDYKDTITDEQYNNRMILREIMTNNGFKPLTEEWWHFTLEDEPFTDTYFDFPVTIDSVK